MPHVRRRIAELAIVAAVSGQAGAATYQYTGDVFNDITDDPSVPGSYTTSDSITSFVEFAAPIAPGLSNADLAGLVIDGSFTSGGFVALTPLESSLSSSVSTDATGSILVWEMLMYQSGGSATPGEDLWIHNLDFGYDLDAATFAKVPS